MNYERASQAAFKGATAVEFAVGVSRVVDALRSTGYMFADIEFMRSLEGLSELERQRAILAWNADR